MPRLMFTTKVMKTQVWLANTWLGQVALSEHWRVCGMHPFNQESYGPKQNQSRITPDNTKFKLIKKKEAPNRTVKPSITDELLTLGCKPGERRGRPCWLAECPECGRWNAFDSKSYQMYLRPRYKGNRDVFDISCLKGKRFRMACLECSDDYVNPSG